MPSSPQILKAVEKPALQPTLSNLLFTLLLLGAWLGNSTAQAQFAYITDNGAITITGYTGVGGAVTIPAAIDGLPVTTIGDYAFAGCSGLNTVTIPNSVILIADGAFQNCVGLTNIYFTGNGPHPWVYCVVVLPSDHLLFAGNHRLGANFWISSDGAVDAAVSGNREQQPGHRGVKQPIRFHCLMGH